MIFGGRSRSWNRVLPSASGTWNWERSHSGFWGLGGRFSFAGLFFSSRFFPPCFFPSGFLTGAAGLAGSLRLSAGLTGSPEPLKELRSLRKMLRIKRIPFLFRMDDCAAPSGGFSISKRLGSQIKTTRRKGNPAAPGGVCEAIWVRIGVTKSGHRLELLVRTGNLTNRAS